MNSLHDDFPQCAQAREQARLAEEAQARAELRDRFAMAALQGRLAREDSPPSYAAHWAYQYAEAMMKERDQ
jgi:hypothetical protein